MAYKRKKGHFRLRLSKRRKVSKKFSKVTAKKIVRKAVRLAQEKKQYDQTATNANFTTFTQAQFGTNIIKGTDLSDRVGTRVFLRGIRVDYTIENIQAPTTITRDFFTTFAVVKTWRDDSLQSMWFKTNSGNNRFAWNATSGKDQLDRTLNTTEYKLLGMKQVRTGALNTNSRAFQLNHGKMWIPINCHVTWYNTGETTPYARNEVKPNITFVMYNTDAATVGAAPDPVVTARLSWYFRE